MANMGGQGPPPPPPMHIRPPGQQFPPPGFQGNGQGPRQNSQIPMNMPQHMVPKMVQQSSRIRDITPRVPLTENDFAQALTTYAAYSVRKVPPLSAKELPSWLRAEVTEDHLDQGEIKREIKRLNEKRKPVAEKRAALAQNQSGQVTDLLDELISNERDPNFDWSLSQIDRVEKDIPSKTGKKLKETAVMLLYFKRAPRQGVDVRLLHQHIQRSKSDAMRPPPLQNQQQQHHLQHQQHPNAHPQNRSRQPSPVRPHTGSRPQSAHETRKEQQPIIVNHNNRAQPRSPRRTKQRSRRHHDYSSSDSDSGSFDSESDSGSNASSSLDTSISSRSRDGRRNSRFPRRSHSRHRPKPRYSTEGRAISPELEAGAMFGQPRQPQPMYAPDVPRNALNPMVDPVQSAYQAGFDVARAQQEQLQPPISQPPVIIERIIERPVGRPLAQRVIERPPLDRVVTAPPAVVSYSRRPPPRIMKHRFIDERERYHDDIRSQEDEYIMRRREMEIEDILRRSEGQQREAEHYIDNRTGFGDRRRGVYDDLSPTREYFDPRRLGGFGDSRDYHSRPEPARRIFNNPTYSQALPRRYPDSNPTGSVPGW